MDPTGFFGYILPMPLQRQLTAEQLNNNQYYEIFNRITNIALSRFKWINLPDSCFAEALETTLFFYGKAVFVKDPNLGYIHTPVNLPGPFNIYNESIIRECVAYEYHEQYDIDNSVLIRANKCMFPDYMTVWNYTPKIANTLRAIDVHVETLKRPFIITGPEKMKNTIKNAVDRISDNEVAIIGQKMDKDVEIKVLSLGVESHLSDMWATVKNYLNQVYSALGVKNSYTEKRERMITSEAEGEGNAIRHTLESELSERELACERINKMFGLDIHVESNQIETFMEELIQEEAARVTGLINQEGDNDVVPEDNV